MVLALATPALHAQLTAVPATAGEGKAPSTVTVNASADASGPRPVARLPRRPGGARRALRAFWARAMRWTRRSPPSASTNELILDRHARSVGDVLQNDPTVRVGARLWQLPESYFIRGFLLDLGRHRVTTALYSLLPRQYIATELFERVEVLRGASAFFERCQPAGGGIGGSINLLPKRAPNEPLNRVSFGAAVAAARNWRQTLPAALGPMAAPACA